MNRGAVLRIATALLAAPLSSTAADEPADLEGFIRWLHENDSSLDGIPFADVVAASTGRKVLAIDRSDPDDARILRAIGSAMDAVLRDMNRPGSPARAESRINEVSRHFEDRLRTVLDAKPGIVCTFPETADGHVQRSGYPDLKVVDEATGRVLYLDPKLYARGSRDGTFRTFYFEPKTGTGKVLDDARHLVVGIEHESTEDGRRFLRWELVDLSGFKVRLKAEFQGGNRDLYRPEAVVGESERK